MTFLGLQKCDLEKLHHFSNFQLDINQNPTWNPVSLSLKPASFFIMNFTLVGSEFPSSREEDDVCLMRVLLGYWACGLLKGKNKMRRQGGGHLGNVGMTYGSSFYSLVNV